MKTLISTGRNISIMEKPDGDPEAVVEVILNVDEPDYRLVNGDDLSSLELVKGRRVETLRFCVPASGCVTLAEFLVGYAAEAEALEKRITFKKAKGKKASPEPELFPAVE